MVRAPALLCAAGAIALCALLAAPGPGAGAGRGADRDCADFSSQAAAQHYFDSRGGSPSNNVDNLDGDGDGIVCEANPCPCAKPGEGGGGGHGGHGHHGGGASKKAARVISVTDGDTVKVRVRGRVEDVRIIGIDTPEVYFGKECGGARASRSMKRLLSRGDRVRLIRDRSQDNRDVYDRLLRYVERSGRDVGRKQLNRGLAEVYVFDSPFARVGSYRRQRNAARAADRGSWRSCGGNFHEPL